MEINRQPYPREKLQEMDEHMSLFNNALANRTNYICGVRHLIFDNVVNYLAAFRGMGLYCYAFRKSDFYVALNDDLDRHI